MRSKRLLLSVKKINHPERRYIGEKWFDGDYKTPYDVESWELAGAKMVQVDGEKIKADTYYRCVDGEVVEAE